jgi:hypothetical protein
LPLTLYITRARWRIVATPGVTEEFPMTVEILYLTAQIQRWVNARVARHLAAQAERLTR